MENENDWDEALKEISLSGCGLDAKMDLYTDETILIAEEFLDIATNLEPEDETYELQKNSLAAGVLLVLSRPWLGKKVWGSFGQRILRLKESIEKGENIDN
jgi:hypothetical protein